MPVTGCERRGGRRWTLSTFGGLAELDRGGEGVVLEALAVLECKRAVCPNTSKDTAGSLGVCDAAERRGTGVRSPPSEPCREDWRAQMLFGPPGPAGLCELGPVRPPCEDRAGRLGSLLAGLVPGVTACGPQLRDPPPRLWLPRPQLWDPCMTVAPPTHNYGTPAGLWLSPPTTTGPPSMAGPSGAWGGL